MEIVNLLLLLIGGGAIYAGLRFWLLTLPKIKPIATSAQSLLPVGQTLAFSMLGIASGVGVLGLALVMGSEANLFFSFFYLFLATLAALWVMTAWNVYSHQRVSETYQPMMITNVILFIFPALIFFYLGLEAVEPALRYPLPKGIPFTNPLVAFYAIFILTGALVAYTLSEREFLKQGKKKGFIEDIFIVAFPAGIIGARLWYVWGQWELEFANQPLWSIFAIWEGGLAIMGGAVGGALVGILYVYVKRKDIVIIKAVDIAVPTILVAQAIGRWGNFFNQEVFGVATDVQQWMWLPTFIREQMTINGSFRVPLFFIESVINLLGYVVIRFGVGVGLKAYRKDGDLALMYLVWYGLTRGIMEPLRNPIYNMGNQGDWSFVWGWIFFGLGLLAIVGNHLLVPLLKPSKK